MSQLQKWPLGLLASLNMKVGGIAPTELGQSVVGVIDVLDLYLAQGELRILRDNTAPALTQSWTRVFTVPAGKVWRVISAGGFNVLNVADVALIVQGAVGITAPNTAPAAAQVFAFNSAQMGTSVRSFGTTFRPPLFITGGWTVNVSSFFSAAITVAGVAEAEIMIQEFDQ
jgi:hypothetical protein